MTGIKTRPAASSLGTIRKEAKRLTAENIKELKKTPNRAKHGSLFSFVFTPWIHRKVIVSQNQVVRVVAEYEKSFLSQVRHVSFGQASLGSSTLKASIMGTR